MDIGHWTFERVGGSFEKDFPDSEGSGFGWGCSLGLSWPQFINGEVVRCCFLGLPEVFMQMLKGASRSSWELHRGGCLICTVESVLC